MKIIRVIASFLVVVIGWPTVFFVGIFSTNAVRDLNPFVIAYLMLGIVIALAGVCTLAILILPKISEKTQAQPELKEQ